jgi:hypothetical protein
MTGVEWRIAELCAQLADGELPRLLAGAGAEATLERVLASIRSGEPAKVTSEDLDTLEDAAARIGIDGLTTGVRSLERGTISTRLPGISGAGPHFAWVCPQHACTRVELDTPGSAAVCAVSGRPLERRTQPG